MMDRPEEDARIWAPAAARNAPYIEAELERLLPSDADVLELASGSGEHALRFSTKLTKVRWWQPTDRDPTRLASIAAWAEEATHDRLAPPRLVDAAVPGWADHEAPVDAVYLANLLHLIEDAAAETVLSGMVRVLRPGGMGLIYGPFLRNGQATSPGDVAFDARIRAENPKAGYKDADWIREKLKGDGASLRETVEMPANNLLIVFIV